MQRFSRGRWAESLATLLRPSGRLGLTLRDNLVLGLSERQRGGGGKDLAARARLEEAVRLAGLESLVAKLPRGLDTRVHEGEGAGLLEGGSGGDGSWQLSAREWAGVELARALVNHDAPLILLDEPLAHLCDDPGAQEAWFARLKAHVKPGQAVLFTTSSPLTASLADQEVHLPAPAGPPAAPLHASPAAAPPSLDPATEPLGTAASPTLPDGPPAPASTTAPMPVPAPAPASAPAVGPTPAPASTPTSVGPVDQAGQASEGSGPPLEPFEPSEVKPFPWSDPVPSREEPDKPTPPPSRGAPKGVGQAGAASPAGGGGSGGGGGTDAPQTHGNTGATRPPPWPPVGETPPGPAGRGPGPTDLDPPARAPLGSPASLPHAAPRAAGANELPPWYNQAAAAQPMHGAPAPGAAASPCAQAANRAGGPQQGPLAVPPLHGSWTGGPGGV